MADTTKFVLRFYEYRPAKGHDTGRNRPGKRICRQGAQTFRVLASTAGEEAQKRWDALVLTGDFEFRGLDLVDTVDWRPKDRKRRDSA